MNMNIHINFNNIRHEPLKPIKKTPKIKDNTMNITPENPIQNEKPEQLDSPKPQEVYLPLEINNAHPRDVRVKFYERDHFYTIDDIRVQKSGTAIVNEIFPHFDADKVIKNMKRKQSWKNHPLYGLTTEEIKEKWRLNGVNASTLGTRMHRAIELYYNNVEQEDPSATETPEFSHFMKFVKNNPNLIPYRTEWSIYDEEYWIAGQIDLCTINVDGTVDLYDWKRCKAIKFEDYGAKMANHPFDFIPAGNYWKYVLQLNLYRYIIQKNYGFKVRNMNIIVCHPNNETYLEYYIPRMGNVIRAILDPHKQRSLSFMDRCRREFRRGVQKLRMQNVIDIQLEDVNITKEFQNEMTNSLFE
jgi:hypothetical protein